MILPISLNLPIHSLLPLPVFVCQKVQTGEVCTIRVLLLSNCYHSYVLCCKKSKLMGHACAVQPIDIFVSLRPLRPPSRGRACMRHGPGVMRLGRLPCACHPTWRPKVGALPVRGICLPTQPFVSLRVPCARTQDVFTSS